MQLAIDTPWGGIESPRIDISEYGKIKYPLKLGQKIAVEQILQWLNDPYSQEYLLRGFAGTGKTTVVQLICAYLKCAAPEIDIGQCAYSHQAKRILIKTSREAGLDIPAMTCCQMLEARPQIDHWTGVLEFRSENNTNKKIRMFDLVIVDEAFGLDSATLEEFRRAVHDTHIKLLFLGDSAQTGPIGELHSPVEEIAGYELTEVVRYDGPILEYATRIRSDLRLLHDLPESTCCEQKITGLWNMDRFTWDKTLKAAFKNFYDQDPYARRVLCFTNNRTAELNAIIRESIYGRHSLGQFMVGERVTFRDPYEETEFSAKFYTSDEVTVLGWEEEAVYTEGVNLDILRVRVQFEDSTTLIPVVKLSSMPRLKKALDDLAKIKSWRMFYRLKGSFAWVDYAYAMTTHKAKGSTFGDAFVDVGDMQTCLYHRDNTDPHGHIIQFNRLLYTAATRPTHRLFLGR